MNKFAIYCKSYRYDIERVKVLVESIEAYNRDEVPFYISCPKEDYSLFKSTLSSKVNLLADEDIVEKTYTQNWHTQQTIKSQFWKLIDIDNYLCIDSDSYFIKPFYLSDFMVDSDTPYTVLHQQKELFKWTARYSRELGFDPQRDFNDTREKIGIGVFNRNFKVNYDFGPSPVVWSTKVWKALEEKYLQPNKLTFEDLINYAPSEFTWYGEALLAFKPIELYPVEPLFLVLHYPLQYQQLLEQQYTEQDIAKCYMGIIMTSNWGAPLKF